MTKGPAPSAPGQLNPMRLDVLQVRGSELAALAHHVVGELLTLIEVAHPRAFDRGDMDEHVLTAIGRLDESKALLRIEKLHITFNHIFPPFKTPAGPPSPTT